jgi:hypothetical protein
VPNILADLDFTTSLSQNSFVCLNYILCMHIIQTAINLNNSNLQKTDGNKNLNGLNGFKAPQDPKSNADEIEDLEVVQNAKNKQF